MSSVNWRLKNLAETEIKNAKTLDKMAARRRETGEHPTADRREAFERRENARRLMEKARLTGL